MENFSIVTQGSSANFSITKKIFDKKNFYGKFVDNKGISFFNTKLISMKNFSITKKIFLQQISR